MSEQPHWRKALLGLAFLADPGLGSTNGPVASEELEDEGDAYDTCTQLPACVPSVLRHLSTAPFLSLPNLLTFCLHLSLPPFPAQ